MRLLLIRHGASHHSQRRLIAGLRACPGLTQEGFRQAQALGARLRDEGFGAGTQLLSSPVLRARQTAEALADALGLPLQPPDCDLCELHPGDADGLTWPEYEQRFGSFDLQAHPERPFAPSGESWRAFLERTQRTLTRLPLPAKQGEGWGEGLAGEGVGGEATIAVTHAGFIVAAFLSIFAIPRPGTGARIDPAHASITEWRRDAGIWQLVRYNVI